MLQALDFSKPDDITNIVSVAPAEQFSAAGISHHPGNILGHAHLLINLGRQFPPTRHVIDISIADGGIGIRRKILDELDLRMNSDQAIEWALQEGHTTRKGDAPGGLGLKLIREFIILNRGRIQITSDSGYWELFPEGEKLTRFDYPFPGTAINIEINTADNSSYHLASEA